MNRGGREGARDSNERGWTDQSKLISGIHQENRLNTDFGTSNEGQECKIIIAYGAYCWEEGGWKKMKLRKHGLLCFIHVWNIMMKPPAITLTGTLRGFCGRGWSCQFNQCACKATQNCHNESIQWIYANKSEENITPTEPQSVSPTLGINVIHFREVYRW
jgi:hypothetical protein